MPRASAANQQSQAPHAALALSLRLMPSEWIQMEDLQRQQVITFSVTLFPFRQESWEKFQQDLMGFGMEWNGMEQNFTDPTKGKLLYYHSSIKNST